MKDIPVPRPEHRSSLQSFIGCYSDGVDKLEDDDVFSILARRQKIRSLQGIYTNYAIQGQYRKSNFPVGRRECNEVIDCMFKDVDSDMAAQLSRLDLGDARQQSFTGTPASRFSDAVVAYWVIIETRTLVMRMSAQAKDGREHGEYQDILASFWCGSWKRTLLQTLDVLEVHDFLYGFLIRKEYHRKREAWAEWSGVWRDLVWETRHAEETLAVDTDWARHLQLFGLCINPIEAARIGSVEEELEDMTPRERLPVNQVWRYLQYHEIPPPLRKYNIETLSMANLLEFNLGYELLQQEAKDRTEGISDHLVEAWAHFRRNWAVTARGRIFQSLESSDAFVEGLRRWRPEPASAPSEEPLPTAEPWLDSFALSLSREALKSWTWFTGA